MSKLAVIWFVLVFAMLFWLVGFWNQKTNNESCDKDYSVTITRSWSYLFGVRPRQERVYLRPASMQSLGLLVLVFGLVSIWFYSDTKVLFGIIWKAAGIGLLICSLTWLTVDIISRLKSG